MDILGICDSFPTNELLLKASRREELGAAIDHVLSSEHLLSAAAGKLKGKLGLVGVTVGLGFLPCLKGNTRGRPQSPI